MTQSDPETALLSRAARGDREAFDAFVVSTAPAVWSLVRRLTLDEATAEDAMQETYVGAWRAAAGFRGEAPARAWLFGLARRQAARTWRRRAGQPARTESLEDLAVAAGWGSDPERAAERGEDRATLLRGLATLSEADQAVLTRCDLEGAAPSEVAELWGIAPGTVRVRLHRARLRLLGALKLEVCDG